MEPPSLTRIESTFRRFLHLPEPSYTLIPPWIAHTWIYMAFPWTPYLLVQSPTQECGKSTLVDLLAAYCYRPFVSCNGTSAAIARLVAAQQPTMIVDEWDSLSPDCRETYFSILNSGAKETGNYLRCEGDDHTPTFMPVYCPKAIVGVHGTKIPNTTLSRCLPFYMQPLPKGVTLDRLRRFTDQPERDRLESWANGARDRLRDAIPASPEGLSGRDRDIWEPLFGVCDDLAEDDWPDRIRNLSLSLDKAVEPGDSTGVRLLAAIKREFDSGTRGKGGVFFSSSGVSKGVRGPDLLALPGVATHVTNTQQLAKLLKPFGIKSRPIRDGDLVFRGYLLEDFKSAWVAHKVDDVIQGELLEAPVFAPPVTGVTALQLAQVRLGE